MQSFTTWPIGLLFFYVNNDIAIMAGRVVQIFFEVLHGLFKFPELFLVAGK
jgi:hypothetical protein